MKRLTLLAALCICTIGVSQEKMISKSGKVTFEASVPSFEQVKAVNKNVTFVLNPATGEIASLALMKGFQFKVALMEEHFNENYIESDRYPKAIFKGKIDGFDFKTLSADFKVFTINGKLQLHGKSKDIKTTARIRKSATGINIISNFTVDSNDFNIEIPNIVKDKVSNKIDIQTDALVN